MKSQLSLALTAMIASITAASSVQAQPVTATRGTQLYVVTDSRLSSKTNHDGDPVVLTVKDGFFHKNPQNLIGAKVDAHIENDTPAGPTHKATMSLVFDDIRLPDGRQIPADVQLRSVKEFSPHTHHIRDAGLIIGGAIVGHHMAHSRGAKHGGLAGGAAGFALASSLKSDIVVNRNAQLTLRLKSDLAE